MKNILNSVGNNAVNLEQDVTTVQILLNKCISRLSPVRSLKEDGSCGPLTVGVILEFQRRVMGIKNPDGRIDPAGNTLKQLNTIATEAGKGRVISAHLVEPLLVQVQSFMQNITGLYNLLYVREKPTLKLNEHDYQNAATLLGADVATIKAVASVESDGGGYLEDGRLKILFEGHWFSRFTEGKYDKSHPSISHKEWTKSHYIGGAGEYNRLSQAEGLNKDAAWKSTSWGKFQIMGFNHQAAGYPTVEGFVNSMKESESKQLQAFIKFLQTKKLDGYLKSKDWASFAKGYNGPKYAENKYDIRLSQAYKAFAATK